MKIQIVKIGKPTSGHYEALVEEFRKRFSQEWKIESVLLKAKEGIERSEAELTQYTKDATVVVALDERGQNYSSPEVAGLFDNWFANPSVKKVSIVIGGPYGLSPAFKSSATLQWSLSKGVMPSDLAWLVVWEQIYRAFTIQKGIKYHHA